MVKLSFYCTDSYGRHFEKAMDENRNWFYREQCYNGYGMAWSKWQKCAPPKKVKFYSIKQEYCNGRKSYRKIAAIDGGFSSDYICVLAENFVKQKMPKYRLPS